MLAGGATAAAVAGAALLKRQLTPQHRKVLGVPVQTPHLDGLVPSGGFDLKAIGKGITKAGKHVVSTSRQLSKLSDDIERVGKSAQKLGDSLS